MFGIEVWHRRRTHTSDQAWGQVSALCIGLRRRTKYRGQTSDQVSGPGVGAKHQAKDRRRGLESGLMRTRSPQEINAPRRVRTSALSMANDTCGRDEPDLRRPSVARGNVGCGL